LRKTAGPARDQATNKEEEQKAPFAVLKKVGGPC